MAEEHIALVIAVVGPIFAGHDGDMVKTINDDRLWAAIAERFEPSAAISFLGRDGEAIGQMVGPFRGAEGYRAGWREWVGPWERFWVELEEMIDAGAGKVLTLVRSIGRLRGSSGEMPQETAAIFTVKNDKIVAIEHYLDHDQAKRAAELA